MTYKKKGFVQNTIIMFTAMFVTKFLGAVLKIPLGNILGGEGMGYFTTAYSIFTPVLAFVCSGIPVIITQTAARYEAAGNYKAIYFLRKSAVRLSAVIGVLGIAVIYISAIPFTKYIANSPDSLFSVFVITPSIFACSVTAVYRGYYEGMSDMFPTAFSQMIEAVVKTIIGITLSYVVYINGERLFGSTERSLPYAAAAALLGVTISEFCGMIYMLLRTKKLNLFEKEKYGIISESDKAVIMKDIFMRSLPVALGGAAANLTSFADMVTVSNCINLSQKLFPGSINRIDYISEAVSGGISNIGNFLYGSYSGIVISVYMLIGALSALIARCSMPKLVSFIEKKDISGVNSCINLMMKGSAAVSVPASFVMAVLAEPVMKLLYPVRLTEVKASVIPLQILSLGGIIGGVCGVISVVFYAYGDFKTPIKISLYSGLVKFISNIIFITIPWINIAGAAIAASVTNIFTAVYSINKAKKLFEISIDTFKSYYPPLLSGTVSSLFIIIIFRIVSENKGAVVGIILSVIIYAVGYFIIYYLINPNDLAAVIESILRKNSKSIVKHRKMM